MRMQEKAQIASHMGMLVQALQDAEAKARASQVKIPCKNGLF